MFLPIDYPLSIFGMSLLEFLFVLNSGITSWYSQWDCVLLIRAAIFTYIRLDRRENNVSIAELDELHFLGTVKRWEIGDLDTPPAVSF